MSLVKAVGTIGGLTMVSRVFGFARDMLLARFLGAGTGADAFFVAFKLPNIFRRLFAEGAFSAAFVPMFSKELHGAGGLAAAQKFSRDVLSVFLPVLFLFTALFEIFMPGIVWLLASAYSEVPGKFELTVELTRITFPYLLLVSLVSLLAGVLNSMSKFAAAAAAPILLNICLIIAVVSFGGTGEDPDFITARALGVAVTVAGLLQFLWLLYAVRRAGMALRLSRPRLTPQVKRLGRIILPATFGAGIYQLSQIIDTFFATRLEAGSMSFLNYADRLNQLPLGVIGIALGTAILPALSRLIGRKDQAGAAKLMGTALELSMLLTLPAAIALAVCAGPLVTAIFVGGKFTAANAAITSNVMAALVLGLPAYVLVKVFTPAFFARGDTRTPVKTAVSALVLNVLIILAMIGSLGIIALPLAAAIAAWFNCALLYTILHRRDYFKISSSVLIRIVKQLLAALAMAAALWWLKDALSAMFAGGVFDRILSIGALVLAGGVVYFSTVYVLGGFETAQLGKLRRKADGS